MTTITEILNTNGILAFAQGSGSSNGWTASSSPITDSNCASGQYYQSQVANNIITATNWTGHSLYANMRKYNTLSSGYGYMTTTTDSIAQCDIETAFVANSGTANQQYSTLMPISRRIDLQGTGAGFTVGDGLHTTVMTVPGAGAPMMFDSLIALSGQAGTPNANLLVTLGDSVTYGTGLFVAGNVWPRKLLRELQRSSPSRNKLTLTNNGIISTMLVNNPGTTNNGCNRQIINQFLNNGSQLYPKYLAIQYGINDMSSFNTYHYGVDQFLLNMDNLCCFIEDAFNPAVSGMIVSIGTPVYIHPTINFQKMMASGTYMTTWNGAQAYELAWKGILRLSRKFQWLRVADVYGAMKRKWNLMYPSATDDFIHPNDFAHHIMGAAHAAAMLGTDLDGTIINSLPGAGYFGPRG